MRHARPVLLALLAALPGFAGCLGLAGSPLALEDAPYPRGVHPWPAGDEWPAGLEGPFGLLDTVLARVPMPDGVELEGAVWLPDLPEGVKAPVVLWSTPYLGQCPSNGNLACQPPPDDARIFENTYRVNTSRLVEHGFAVAAFNVRGTGNSGGCWDAFGPAEQDDQAVLVEWLGTQEWSNGRVAMYGHSYSGTTPWMAAVRNPPHLKTIVPSGIITDLYTFDHTPQGAAKAGGGAFWGAFAASVSLAPPVGGPPEHFVVEHAPVAPERVCPEVAAMLAGHATGPYAGARDAGFYEARSFLAGLRDVTAAVLVHHGFHDNSGHAVQEDLVWGLLERAPKRMILGNWGHILPPPPEEIEDAPFGPDWYDDGLFPWLDFWLKGVGEPPRLGVVDYEDTEGAWRASTAWPPAEAREEALYLADGALAAAPGAGATTFRAEPLWDAPGCFEGDAGKHVAFVSEPAAADVVLAGNPYLALTLTSDLPGGVVAFDLLDVEDAPACRAGSLAWGGADLRYHAGNLGAEDFPTGTPTVVRVDFFNVAHRLPAGHRLAVVARGPYFLEYEAEPWAPTVTLDGAASALVVPLVSGTLGGAPPAFEVPPRPFSGSA